jgi:hypothetical protein
VDSSNFEICISNSDLSPEILTYVDNSIPSLTTSSSTRTKSNLSLPPHFHSPLILVLLDGTSTYLSRIVNSLRFYSNCHLTNLPVTISQCFQYKFPGPETTSLTFHGRTSIMSFMIALVSQASHVPQRYHGVA